MGIILYGHSIVYILVGFYYRNLRARSQAGDFFDPRLSELCLSPLGERGLFLNNIEIAHWDSRLPAQGKTVSLPYSHRSGCCVPAVGILRF